MTKTIEYITQSLYQKKTDNVYSSMTSEKSSFDWGEDVCKQFLPLSAVNDTFAQNDF